MFEILFIAFFALLIIGQLCPDRRKAAKKPVSVRSRSKQTPAAKNQLTLSNSTSKIRAEFGGIV
jgi:hypothetical protein